MVITYSESKDQPGKVANPDHGDNALFRPIGTQIATNSLPADKLCDTLQAMAPTNVKTVHKTSLLHIEINLDRFEMLSPTHGQRSQHLRADKPRSDQFDQQA